ncbi:MAG: aldose 1-epimerase family protein [Eubacteriales bacterium]|nr:aldose 1-epimerase family protein [Eubacteriales bacterium]
MTDILNHGEALRRGYIGRPEQLIENDEVSLRQGDGRTLSCQKIALPGGLAATVAWDRCMDVTRLSYRGVPIAYLGKNAERNDLAMPFESRFSGGMLYTCGLLNVGPGDEGQPTHGRIHSQSANLRGVSLTDSALVLQGEMREAALLGENLLLRRKLEFPLDKAEVRLCDTIVNQTAHQQPYMLLYHINLGYPFLSEALKLTLPQGTETRPADENAREHVGEILCCSAPDPGFAEQDYSHQLPPENGWCRVTAVNEDLGIRLTIGYRADTLPLLQQWRCLHGGDYVLGLEPTNNRVNGRAAAAAEGSLPVLAPFETVTTEVTLTFDTP